MATRVSSKRSTAKSAGNKNGPGSFPSKDVFLTKLLKEKAYLEVFSWDFTNRLEEIAVLYRAMNVGAFLELLEQLDAESTRPGAAPSKIRSRKELVRALDQLTESTLDLFRTSKIEMSKKIDTFVSIGSLACDLQMAFAHRKDKEMVRALRVQISRWLVTSTPISHDLEQAAMHTGTLASALFGVPLRGETMDSLFQPMWTCFESTPEELVEACLDDISFYTEHILSFVDSSLAKHLRIQLIHSCSRMVLHNYMLARGRSLSTDVTRAQGVFQMLPLPEKAEVEFHRATRAIHEALKRFKMVTRCYLDWEEWMPLVGKVPEFLVDSFDCNPLCDVMNEFYSMILDEMEGASWSGNEKLLGSIVQLHSSLGPGMDMHRSKLHESTFRSNRHRKETDFVGYVSLIVAAVLRIPSKTIKFLSPEEWCNWFKGHDKSMLHLIHFLSVVISKKSAEFHRLASDKIVFFLASRFQQACAMGLSRATVSLVSLLGFFLSPAFVTRHRGTDRVRDECAVALGYSIESLVFLLAEDFSPMYYMMDCARYLIACDVEVDSKTAAALRMTLNAVFAPNGPGLEPLTHSAQTKVAFMQILSTLLAHPRACGVRARLGNYAEPSIWGKACTRVVQDWSSLGLEDLVRMCEAMATFSAQADDAVDFIKSLERATRVRPSHIVKSVTFPAAVTERPEDVDGLLSHYFIMMANIAVDRLKGPEDVADDNGSWIDEELQLVVEIGDSLLNLPVEDLTNLPEAIWALAMVLGPLALRWKPQVARLLFRFLDLVEASGPDSQKGLFRQLESIPEYHYSDFCEGLCLAISNTCSQGLDGLFLGDDHCRRLFSEKVILFVLTTLRTCDTILWGEDSTLFAALHNLVCRSLENRWFLVHQGGFGVLLEMQAEENKARSQEDASDCEVKRNYLKRLICVVRKDQREAVQDAWKKALRNVDVEFDESDLKDFEPPTQFKSQD